MSNIIDKNLEKELENLGFSSKEASVYLSLLGLGEVGASKIVKTTGLHGQFVYDALNGLEKRDLVKHSIIKNRKKFSAKSPENILLLAEQRKKAAESLVEKLKNSLVLVDENTFETYQGPESFISHELKSLDDQEENSEILVLGGSGNTFIKSMSTMFNEYEFRRNKKNISVRYIGTELENEHLNVYDKERKDFKFRKLPGIFGEEVNIVIFSNKISFNFLNEQLVIFDFSNKKLANSYRQFFEVLWKLGK